MTQNSFSLGIEQDVLPKFQPSGKYRTALNSVLETEVGELLSISNEKGNLVCADDLPTSKILIGHVLLDNDEAFLTLYDPDGNHEVGILNTSSCTYTTLSIDTCWNFSDKYPVNMLFRIRNGCERVVYMTDNYNEYRVVNLTDTSYWLDGTDVIDCNRIKLYKDHNIPCISLFQGEGDLGVKDSGGSIENGLYYFFVRYLDSELNPTNWIIGTRPIAIADETFEYTTDAGTTNLYDGGSNVATSPYYVAPSNKSVTLQLTSLDNATYSFYQLAVVKRTGDSGEIAGVDVLYPVPITSSTSKYIYTNSDSQIFGETTLEDLLTPFQAIDKVKAHAQKDNRLLLAGVTNSTYEWSTFQRYASKIKAQWLKNSSTSPVDTFVKQPRYYFYDASFMEDEVYALGIVYVMEDGSLSPVFHIPGRPIDVVTGTNPLIGAVSGVADDGDNWDSGTTTSYGTGLPASKTKRWQQISTATKDSAFASKGLMGYHEAITATYPDIETCDGESYWGEDWQGNAIEAGVTKIRHHRMPPSHLYSNASSQAPTSQVGILFSNVEYPQGVVKHYFVYGDRTFEKSILAKGLLIPIYSKDDRDPGDAFPSTGDDLIFHPSSIFPLSVPLTSSPANVRTYAFICSEGVLKDKSFSPRYFQLERYLEDPEFDYGLGANSDDADVNIEQYNTSLRVLSYLGHFRLPSYPTSRVNYSIDSSLKIPKATYGSKSGAIVYNPTDVSVQNLSFNISPLIITLEDQLDEWVADGNTPDNIFPFGSLKVDVDPFTELTNIQYKRMGNCAFTAVNTSSQFQSYSGDTFVSRLNLTDYQYWQAGDDKTVQVYHLAFPTQDTLINYEFRHGSNDPQYSYFQWNYQYDPAGHALIRNHMASKYYEATDNIMELYPQNFDYNDSYSYIQNLEVYLPLPFNYEYCKDCIEYFPYRVYYSELDNSEDQSDKYRIFRVNNYKDLPGETGFITDLFVNFNQLYARTTNSIYHLPTTPQQLKSDEASIYIGTGEVFSLPAQALKTSENAFGGGNFFKARTTTEYGTVYVDDLSGRVFLLTNQLNDISQIGLRNFFQNNGRVQFLHDFYSSTGIDFPFLSTSSPSGVGYISWYDPRYKRVFIHKRDFVLEDVYSLTYEAEETDIAPRSLDDLEVRFNGFSFYTKNSSEDIVQITFDDVAYFENKSFTLSYSFLTNHWVSYHSYLPQYAFGGHRDFYSFKEGLYEHNNGDFTTYYGIKYPHMVDIIAANDPLTAKLNTSILYSSITSLYDTITKHYTRIPDTYNGFIAYNSNQSTGYNDVILKTDPFTSDTSNSEILVRSTDKQYRINNLRDLTVNQSDPIWDSSWASLQSSYYIDKVPYTPNLDTNQSMYSSKRFRDHYLGLRLFFNPTINAKINTDIVATMQANRNR